MPRNPRAKVLWFARLERRFHRWRERRARARGLRPAVTGFPGYGTEEWVRVLGRVLIAPPTKRTSTGELESLRGWRSFAAVPVGFAHVTVVIDGVTHQVAADRGGVIDAKLPATLKPGWQSITMSVEGSDPAETRVFVVGSDVRFGVVSDIDDTVMVTALPVPCWPPGTRSSSTSTRGSPSPEWRSCSSASPGAPGHARRLPLHGAWNVAPTLTRFMRRHLFPAGSFLLTDWGPTHDRWFRSGRDHKELNLRRLAAEFPQVKWLLVGDDGQHDDAIYTGFAIEHPRNVEAVAIRRLLPAEAVLAGGRTVVDDHSAAEVPWVTGSDGAAALLDRLEDVGVISRNA